MENEGFIEKWPSWINLDKKISDSPLNYCVRNGHIPDDKIHFGYDMFLKFVDHYKKEFTILNR